MFFAAPVAAGERLFFSASVGEPFTNAQGSGFEDRLLREIFRRLGYEIDVGFVAAERALRNLDQGVDDGALGRVAGILEQYPHIHQIEEVAFVRDFVVFTRKARFAPDDWASLAPYDVGFITGWKILEHNVTEARSVIKTKDGRQLFELLARDRVDLVIYNRWGGLYLLKQLGMTDVHLLEPPLASAPHYFNLHESHAALVEPARQTLIDMKRDGTYRKIFEETLAPLAR